VLCVCAQAPLPVEHREGHIDGERPAFVCLSHAIGQRTFPVEVLEAIHV
jgi:hypothetical protein